MANRDSLQQWLDETAQYATAPIPAAEVVQPPTEAREMSIEEKMAVITGQAVTRAELQLSKVIGGVPAASAMYLHERDFANDARIEISENRTAAAMTYLAGRGFVADARPGITFGSPVTGEKYEQIEYTFWNLGVAKFGRVEVLAMLKDMRRRNTNTKALLGRERQMLLVNCAASAAVLGAEPYLLPEKTLEKVKKYKESRAESQAA